MVKQTTCTNCILILMSPGIPNAFLFLEGLSQPHYQNDAFFSTNSFELPVANHACMTHLNTPFLLTSCSERTARVSDFLELNLDSRV